MWSLLSLSFFPKWYFSFTTSSLEISKGAIKCYFSRNIKGRHQELEMLFRTIFLIKNLRRSLSLVELLTYSSFTKTELFHRDLQNIYFDTSYQRVSISCNSFWWLLLKHVNSNICIRYVEAVVQRCYVKRCS